MLAPSFEDLERMRLLYGVEAHRPLGNIMRARRHVYPIAAGHRSKLTGCPLHEPSTLPDL